LEIFTHSRDITHSENIMEKGEDIHVVELVEYHPNDGLDALRLICEHQKQVFQPRRNLTRSRRMREFIERGVREDVVPKLSFRLHQT